jgi:hypothetical protein
MRAALFVVFVSVLTTPSEASKSCMSKTEARQQFGSYIYWHGPDIVGTRHRRVPIAFAIARIIPSPSRRRPP